MSKGLSRKDTMETLFILFMIIILVVEVLYVVSHRKDNDTW